MLPQKYLGTITILVKDRQINVAKVNKILTDNGRMIMARLGVNVQRICVKNCTGLIVVSVEGTAKEINNLTKKIDRLYGIIAKVSIMKD